MQLTVEYREGQLQVADNIIRKQCPQIRRDYAGPVGGGYISKTHGRTACQKVLHPLGRSQKTGASVRNNVCSLPCRLFDPPLKREAGKRMIVSEILRPNADQQSGIAVFSIPGMIAHAIDHNPFGLGSSGNHMAAGAHAEGIDTPAVPGMAGKLVGSGAKTGMSRKGTELAAVDHLPWVLDPYPDGEGLLSHNYPILKQVLHGIPCRMADAEKNGIRYKIPQASALPDNRSRDPAVSVNQMLKTGFKQDGSTQGKNFLTDGSTQMFG